MQIYQDKETGEEWHFEREVDVSSLNGVPATLSSVVVSRPDQAAGAHNWDKASSAWIPDVDAEKKSHNDAVFVQIGELEARQLRPVRELMFDAENAFAKNKLAQLDADIAALRATMK